MKKHIATLLAEERHADAIVIVGIISYKIMHNLS